MGVCLSRAWVVMGTRKQRDAVHPVIAFMPAAGQLLFLHHALHSRRAHGLNLLGAGVFSSRSCTHSRATARRRGLRMTRPSTRTLPPARSLHTCGPTPRLFFAGVPTLPTIAGQGGGDCCATGGSRRTCCFLTLFKAYGYACVCTRDSTCLDPPLSCYVFAALAASPGRRERCTVHNLGFRVDSSYTVHSAIPDLSLGPALTQPRWGCTIYIFGVWG
ncbi:hypothetical protein T484DRAFT_1934099 [Baffinella frigidus]|nr:hypothetical protein T484DRAFT_1934099 [Cryptophyta sp. CCMP2293]